jgi:uncharacterized protein (DUF1015 family)
MAILKPFQAIRPRKDLTGRIAALPYDVYNRKEATEAAAKEPLSFLRIDRAETQFPEEVDTYADCVYQKARELFRQELEKGYYVRDPEESYYIYQLTMDGRSQTGIVACASVDDYENQVIKKHENTRAEKEADRIRHVDTVNAQTGPIFLAYRAQEKINRMVEEAMQQAAEFDFVSEDGIRHKGWRISEPDRVSQLEQAFREVPALYIADGHHRAASAVRVGEKRRREHPGYTGEEAFNYFLSVLFPDDQLMIMDYNRVVRDLNGLTEEAFKDKVAQFFTIKALGQAAHPTKKGEISMFLSGNWYGLTAKPEILSADPVEGLDVSLLQRYLLHPILGIADPKTDKRIDFVGGIRGLSELERRVKEDMCVAFAMYPTSIRELFAVADAGRLMPPKSTWFEPKLRSGLFIHDLEEGCISL